MEFLRVEVPRWRSEHACYSCHNTGDAARALVAASRRGHAVSAALEDTLSWLTTPHRWDQNATGGGFDDKPLARIQFASALAAAVDAELAPRSALVAAAGLVAADQKDDGSWRLDASQSAGSPATYGTALATWSARRTLVGAGAPAFQPAITRADRWLRDLDPKNVWGLLRTSRYRAVRSWKNAFGSFRGGKPMTDGAIAPADGWLIAGVPTALVAIAEPGEAAGCEAIDGAVGPMRSLHAMAPAVTSTMAPPMVLSGFTRPPNDHCEASRGRSTQKH